MQFSKYMNSWLYAEQGYYKDFKEIGKAGDFYTAVSTSSFFGASIANHFYNLIQKESFKRNGWIIEIGAHQGYLICDMIQWLYTLDPSLVKTLKFGIVERQSEVQKAQLAYISERFGDDIKITHFNDIDEVAVDYAFVVSNEIFDAFPCELIKDGEQAYIESHTVEWREADSKLLEFASKHRQVKGEVAVGYEEFAKAVSKGVKRCDFVSFDYGERFVRNDFSIRVYQKHKTFPLFDEELKLEEVYQSADITYDVNFGHVIDAFVDAGFELDKYETQARALVRFGLIDILEMFAKQTSQSNYLREADKIKTLIAPTIMGDKFKMLHFYK
jgi:SAM-dependent MidA family methyltransferase